MRNDYRSDRDIRRQHVKELTKEVFKSQFKATMKPAVGDPETGKLRGSYIHPSKKATVFLGKYRGHAVFNRKLRRELAGGSAISQLEGL